MSSNVRMAYHVLPKHGLSDKFPTTYSTGIRRFEAVVLRFPVKCVASNGLKQFTTSIATSTIAVEVYVIEMFRQVRLVSEPLYTETAVQLSHLLRMSAQIRPTLCKEESRRSVLH